MTSERKINGRNLRGHWHGERYVHSPQTREKASAAQRKSGAGGYHGR